MSTYTVSVTGPGALAGRFEQLLDVLPAAALEGSEHSEVVTLYFDVRARHRDAAIEAAFLRAQGAIGIDDPIWLSVVRSSTVEGRKPWWRRVLSA